MSKQGGKRIAGKGKKIGRPKKEPTETISFRVPANRKVELFSLLSEYLASFLK